MKLGAGAAVEIRADELTTVDARGGGERAVIDCEHKGKALNFSFNVAGLFSGTAAADDAAAAAEDDEEGGEDDDIDRVIGELCEMFEAEHGRAPTDDEVKIWVSQINEANLAGASG